MFYKVVEFIIAVHIILELYNKILLEYFTDQVCIDKKTESVSNLN